MNVVWAFVLYTLGVHASWSVWEPWAYDLGLGCVT